MTTNTEPPADVVELLDNEIQRVMDAAPRLDYVQIPLQVAAKCRQLAAIEQLTTQQPNGFWVNFSDRGSIDQASLSADHVADAGNMVNQPAPSQSGLGERS